MSFKINANFNACNCKKLTISDITGLFDAINNIGGWDVGTLLSGNPSIASVESITLKIEMSNGVIYDNIDILSSGHFPSLVAGQELNLDDGDIGGSLVDGLAIFTITVVGTNTDLDVPDITWTSRILGYITCGVSCCVQMLGSKVDPHKIGCKECDSSASDAFNEAKRMLVNLEYAKECCQFHNADVILQALKNFCQNNKCPTC